jgi:hypothetical protein
MIRIGSYPANLTFGHLCSRIMKWQPDPEHAAAWSAVGGVVTIAATGATLTLAREPSSADVPSLLVYACGALALIGIYLMIAPLAHWWPWSSGVTKPAALALALCLVALAAAIRHHDNSHESLRRTTSGPQPTGSHQASSAPAPTTGAQSSTNAPGPPSSSEAVNLSLRASASVYVCLIGDNGRKLIPGMELQAGKSTPTYHATRFAVTLGNSSVTMYVDGRARTVPPSSEAIGYSVTKSGRHRLKAGQLPTCA